MATRRKETVISPEDLEKVLELSVPYVMRFADEKKMQSYRSMLYSINKQNRGSWAYTTKRIGPNRIRVTRISEDY